MSSMTTADSNTCDQPPRIDIQHTDNAFETEHWMVRRSILNAQDIISWAGLTQKTTSTLQKLSLLFAWHGSSDCEWRPCGLHVSLLTCFLLSATFLKLANVKQQQVRLPVAHATS